MPNIRIALRTLFRTPFVTTVAVLSLALGIGANAGIFSLFNEMLLRALPVPSPEELVNLSSPGPKPGSQSCNQAGDCDEVFSYAMYRDLEKSQDVLTGLAAHRLFGANMAIDDQTLSGDVMLVSGSYFQVLALKPAIGRLFGPADDQTIGGHYVAVLGNAFWKNRLGSDPAIVGRTIIINGQQMIIVGVAPAGFDGTTLGTRPDVYVPISMRAQMTPGFNGFENRRSYWVYVFGRRKPGVTADKAALALNSIYHPIITDVEAPLQEGMSDQTMARFRDKKIELTDGRRGQSSTPTEAKKPLLFLFAITGIVLLIACANIANLLLARGANRSMDMAIRLSLGASRRQLLGQLLVESCLLALMGGLASLLVAHWTLTGIAAMLPSDAVETLNFELSLPVILFAGILSIGTGMLFGLFPALHSTRPDLVTTIRSAAGNLSSSRSASRFRNSLVTAQIALSMALLASAGLFIRSLANVSRVDLGIKVENLATFSVSPELNGYSRQRSQIFFARLEQELASTPGVKDLAVSLVPLLTGSNWGSSVQVQGFQSGPDVDNGARFNEVGPGYFRVLGVPILSGREFTSADVTGAQQVAVVNQAFARKFGLGSAAVGKFMSNSGAEKLDIQIVGLAKDAKYSEVKAEVPPMFYVPYKQDSTVGSASVYVRSSLPPEQILHAIPAVVRRLDPNLPVEQLKTMPQQVRENIFLDRMISILSAAFAVLATLLAAVGLYGVLAYSIAQRTREIGVRMALGADSGRVLGMVLRQVGVMLLIGGLIGIAGAVALGRSMRSLLYELHGWDPVVLAGATLLLSVVALGAGYIPALRASRVHPMQALRYE
jgi:predicted permease